MSRFLSEKRSCGRANCHWPPPTKPNILSLVVTLAVLTATAQGALTNLVSLLSGISPSMGAGGAAELTSPERCSDDDPGTQCDWKRLTDCGSCTETLIYSLSGPVNIGSVVFAATSDTGKRGYITLTANTSTGQKVCNNGAGFLSEGVVNCIAADVLQLVITYIGGPSDLRFGDIQAFAQPDYLQLFFQTQSMMGIFSWGNIHYPIGPVQSGDELVAGVKVIPDTQGGIWVKYEIEPSKALTNAIFYFFQQQYHTNTMTIEYVPTDLTAAQSCGGITTNDYTNYDGVCAGPSAAFQVVTLGTYLYMNNFAIFPQNECTFATGAFFDFPVQNFQYDPVVGAAMDHPLTFTYQFEPSWCEFTAQPVISVFTDYACTSLDSSGIVTFDGSSTLTVQTIDTALVGQTLTYYVTAGMDSSSYFTEPLEVQIKFDDVCSSTTLDSFTILDVTTVYNVPEVVQAPIPQDSASTAAGQGSLCGERTLVITDLDTGAQNPTYLTWALSTTTPNTLDLTIVAVDIAQIGTHNVRVAFTLQSQPSKSSHYDFVASLTCPADLESFTYISNPPMQTFSHDTYLAPQPAYLSTYTYAPTQCFSFQSYEVYEVDPITLQEVDQSYLFIGYNESTSELWLNGDYSLSAFELQYKLYINLSTTVRLHIDTFKVSWHNCQGTYFTPALGYLVTSSLAIDQSTTIYIDSPNYEASIQNDPLFCGYLLASYYNSLTFNTVPYVTFGNTVSGDTIDFIVTTPVLHGVSIGTQEFYVDVTLSDHSPYATFTVQITFLCPVTPLTYGTLITITSFVHEFSDPPSTWSMTPVTDVAQGDCLTFTTSVVTVPSLVPVAYLNYDMVLHQVTTDVYHVEFASIVGQVMTFQNMITDDNGQTYAGDQYTVSFTGPANAECYFTELQADYSLPSDPIIHVFGLPKTIKGFAEPTDARDELSPTSYLCGDRVIGVNILEQTSTEQVFLAIRMIYDYTFNFRVNTANPISPNTEECIGTYNVEITISLLDFPDIPAVSAQVLVVVTCPSDGTLIDPAEVTIPAMETTEFTYHVSSNENLVGTLPNVEVISICQNVTDSYVIRRDTPSRVDFIVADWESKTFALMTTDDDLSLRETTVDFSWLIDITGDQKGVELATFSVQFIGQNNLPYFKPQLPYILPIRIDSSNTLWSYLLDPHDDDQGDEVTVTVDLGDTSAFMSYTGDKKLEISDLKSSLITPGKEYSFKVTASDGKDTVVRDIILIITDETAEVEPAAPDLEIIEPEENQDAEEDAPTLSETNSQVAKASPSKVQEQIEDWREKAMQLEQLLQDSGAIFMLQPPRPRIAKVSQTGEITISFDQDMQIVPLMEMLKTGTIDYQGVIYPVLQFEVVPSPEQRPENLEFHWEIVELLKRSATFRLQFKDAMHVSAYGSPDVLRMTFRDPYMFVGINNLAISDKTNSNSRKLGAETQEEFITLDRELPQQMQLEGTAQAVQEVVSSVQGAAKFAVASNVVINILIAASLQQLWSMINTQQLIVMMPLFKIQMPANAGIFFSHMMSIAAFDFYDFTDIIQDMLEIEPTDPLDANFEAIGFESRYFLVNMGSMAVFYLFYFLLVFLNSLLALCCDKCDFLGRVRARLNSNVYWGHLITLINESYSILIVCVLINIQMLSFQTKGLTIMSALCITFMSLSVLVPLCFFLRLQCNVRDLHEKKWTESHGALYQGLKTKAGKKFLLVPVFFLVRRALLGIAVCVVNQALIYQIFLMWAQITVQTIILGLDVFESESSRRNEFFNEIVLMMVLYTVICFSPWLDDVLVKFIIGYFACFLVLFHFGINLLLILKATYVKLRWKCLKRSTMKTYKAKRVKLQQRLEQTRLHRSKLRQEKRAVVAAIVPSESSLSVINESSEFEESEDSDSQISSEQSFSLSKSLEQKSEKKEFDFPAEKIPQVKIHLIRDDQILNSLKMNELRVSEDRRKPVARNAQINDKLAKLKKFKEEFGIDSIDNLIELDRIANGSSQKSQEEVLTLKAHFKELDFKDIETKASQILADSQRIKKQAQTKYLQTTKLSQVDIMPKLEKSKPKPEDQMRSKPRITVGPISLPKMVQLPKIVNQLPKRATRAAAQESQQNESQQMTQGTLVAPSTTVQGDDNQRWPLRRMNCQMAPDIEGLTKAVRETAASRQAGATNSDRFSENQESPRAEDQFRGAFDR